MVSKKAKRRLAIVFLIEQLIMGIVLAAWFCLMLKFAGFLMEVAGA